MTQFFSWVRSSSWFVWLESTTIVQKVVMGIAVFAVAGTIGTGVCAYTQNQNTPNATQTSTETDIKVQPITDANKATSVNEANITAVVTPTEVTEPYIEEVNTSVESNATTEEVVSTKGVDYTINDEGGRSEYIDPAYEESTYTEPTYTAPAYEAPAYTAPAPVADAPDWGSVPMSDPTGDPWGDGSGSGVSN